MKIQLITAVAALWCCGEKSPDRPDPLDLFFVSCLKYSIISSKVPLQVSRIRFFQ
jgi:hypothetical protein